MLGSSEKQRVSESGAETNAGTLPCRRENESEYDGETMADFEMLLSCRRNVRTKPNGRSEQIKQGKLNDKRSRIICFCFFFKI